MYRNQTSIFVCTLHVACAWTMNKPRIGNSQLYILTRWQTDRQTDRQTKRHSNRWTDCDECLSTRIYISAKRSRIWLRKWDILDGPLFFSIWVTIWSVEQPWFASDKRRAISEIAHQSKGYLSPFLSPIFPFSPWQQRPSSFLQSTLIAHQKLQAWNYAI